MHDDSRQFAKAREQPSGQFNGVRTNRLDAARCQIVDGGSQPGQTDHVQVPGLVFVRQRIGLAVAFTDGLRSPLANGIQFSFHARANV